MCSEKFARGKFYFSQASRVRVFVSQTRKRRRQNPWQNRAAGFASLGYRAPPKNEGSDPRVRLKLEPTIARARSFHSFVRSFTEKIHEPESGSAGLHRASWEDAWMFALCAIRVPAKCAIFSIRHSRSVHYDLTGEFDPPITYFSIAEKNTFCRFCRRRIKHGVSACLRHRKFEIM